MYSAKFMFENNIAEIHSQLGEPESVKSFTENYITPALKADSQSDIEIVFVEAISDCQFDGFVLGFNTAVKFLIGCVMERGINI